MSATKYPKTIASGNRGDLEPAIFALAIDPGTTVGFTNYIEFDFDWQWAVWHQPYEPREIYERIKSHKPTEIILESYDPANEKSHEVDALKVCGIVELYAAQYKVPLIYQSPSEAKSFSTDKKLKANGLYVPGAPHGNDSSRHMFRHLVCNKRQTHWLKALKK